MKRALLTLTAVGLAASLSAQTTNTLTGTVGAGVSAMIKGNTAVTKTLTATAIDKPVYLSASAKGTTTKISAYTRMSAGLYAPSKWSMMNRIGGYLNNYGRAYGTTAETAQAAALKQAPKAFNWKYVDVNDLDGTLTVIFSGYCYGGVKPTATFGADTFAATKDGRFSFKKELPISKTKTMDYTFEFAADTGLTEKAYYSASLTFVYRPTPVLPALTWTTNAQKNCAAGALGQTGTVAWDKEFNVTLTGAIDAKGTYAMLLTGSKSGFGSWMKLPFDLTKFGLKDCWLYTSFFFPHFVKFDTAGTAAKAPFTLKTKGFYARYFKGMEFQWAYPTAKSLVFTNSGTLATK